MVRGRQEAHELEPRRQLTLLPAFYLGVLSGLPGTGPKSVPFSAAGIGTHAEGFVVEFTLSTAERWVGNFQPGAG